MTVCKFAQFIPVQIPIVPNGKYPHSEVVMCQTLLDCIVIVILDPRYSP